MGALKEHAVDLSIRNHRQIGSTPGRLEEGVRGADASSAANRRRCIADSLLLGAIDVGTTFQTHLLAGLQDGFGQRATVRLNRYVQRATDAALAVIAQFVVLEFAEATADLLPAPARITDRFPAVIIFGLAPHVHHSVDAARAAQDPTAHPDTGPKSVSGVGLRCVVPVQSRIR